MGTRITLAAVALFLIGLAPLIPVPWSLDQFAPLSLVTVIPAFFAATNLTNFVGEIPGAIVGGLVGAVIAPLVFFLISERIVTGKITPAWASIVVFLIVMALSFVMAALNWSYTVQFTSLDRAVALAIQSLLPPLLLTGVYLKNRSYLTGWRLITIHWFALAWFTWSAFPWWGELI
jgi:hypothetical protein